MANAERGEVVVGGVLCAGGAAGEGFEQIVRNLGNHDVSGSADVATAADVQRAHPVDAAGVKDTGAASRHVVAGVGVARGSPRAMNG